MSAETACRSCGATSLLRFLSLGEMPLTDAYVSPERANEPEPRYPLDVAFCPSCTLVQLQYTVPAEAIFRDYAYYSSFSPTLLAHSREHARELIGSRNLGSDSLVIELASNDGYLLRTFVEEGIPVLGIDPAIGPADAAEAIGVPTMREFFGVDVADRLTSEGTRADVVIANNVLAHVPDLNGFVEGIATILADDGIAEIEVPYVRELIERLEFDTIYHEHLCYFSVTALDALFGRHGLSLNRVRPFAIHGGSLRLTVGRRQEEDNTVQAHLEAEAAEGLDRFDHYRGFGDRVEGLQAGLREMLERLRRSGKRIAAYGAAAKGTILLNSSGIGPDLIAFVADKSPHKQGKLMPGVRIPIVAARANPRGDARLRPAPRLELPGRDRAGAARLPRGGGDLHRAHPEPSRGRQGSPRAGGDPLIAMRDLMLGLDAEKAGAEMFRFMEELFPICRSITGDGIRETLRRIGERIPLELHEVPSGTEVFDWTVPKEWNIRDAYIEDPRGRRVVDLADSNLHVVSYSVPVDTRMPLSELKEHIHTLPDQPDLIPYRTSYYSEAWGFCMAHEKFQALEDGEYVVRIDSSLEPGSLTYGECFLPGETEAEILISCHCCHPSLANDNLSGIALATRLAEHLRGLSLRYSYRFLFIPGTIGSITWLARNEHRVDRIKHGLVVTGVGDPGPATYKRSRRGDAPIDRAAAHVLGHSGQPYDVVDFSPYGYDERQYCSPASTSRSGR